MPDRNPIQKLFYITHVDNLRSILNEGVMSHDLVTEKGITHRPIYDPQVVERRHNREVLNEGRPLWSYANLFFQPRNPMMYRVKYEADDISNVVVIGVNPSVMQQPGVVVTDGNVASGATDFYPASQVSKIVPTVREALKMRVCPSRRRLRPCTLKWSSYTGQGVKTMNDETPYEELDVEVVGLCRTINRLPGLRTIGSCGGHKGGGQTEEEIGAGTEYRGELPADNWRVTFQLEFPGSQRRPTVDAWLSLEWAVWVIENAMRGSRVDVMLYAPPPFLNEPGRCLRFTIFGSRSGEHGVEADEVARFFDEAEASVMAGPPE